MALLPFLVALLPSREKRSYNSMIDSHWA